VDKLNDFLNWETNDLVLDKFFNWIRFDSNLKTLKLDISDSIENLKNEIIPKIPVSVVHRELDGKGWRSATLHGYSSLMTDDDNYYKGLGFNLPPNKSWTSLSIFFPETKKWILENIPFANFGRIRIMILEPGGYVAPHKDFPNGNCLAGINIAITHPKEVKYVIDGDEIDWAEGDSRLINIGSTHAIYNNSNEPRVHIIVHSEPIDKWSNEMMRIVCQSYIKESASK
jgi:hypothetical protein